jgi:RNA polymerase sigma factor (sigma-70 family)
LRRAERVGTAAGRPQHVKRDTINMEQVEFLPLIDKIQSRSPGWERARDELIRGSLGVIRQKAAKWSKPGHPKFSYEDVRQELEYWTLTRVHDYKRELSGWKHFLSIVLNNHMIDEWRRHEVETVLESELHGNDDGPAEGGLDALQPEASGQEDIALRELARRDVRECLEKLSVRWRLAILLTDVHGVADREVAKELGLKRTTFIYQRGKKRERLGRCLEERYPDVDDLLSAFEPRGES